jgi:transcriptional regulator with XRE-family HTH domain
MPHCIFLVCNALSRTATGITVIRIRLRELRELRGLTQTALAERAGVRRATVNRIENARVLAIDLSVLEKLAVALDVDAAMLIEHTRRTRKADR